MNDTDNMIISLHIKKPSQFFWLCKIHGVDISRCCKKCFHGESEGQLYHGTAHGQTPRFIELKIKPADKYVAYYLCGLSAGFKYENNTHVAFVHAPGELLQVDTPQIALTIKNARRIDFEDYKPNPPGDYTEEQRRCRNWIFANYIRDGMINNVGGAMSTVTNANRAHTDRRAEFDAKRHTRIDALNASIAVAKNEAQRTALQEALEMIMRDDIEEFARIVAEESSNVIGQISELLRLLKAMTALSKHPENMTTCDWTTPLEYASSLAEKALIYAKEAAIIEGDRQSDE